MGSGENALRVRLQDVDEMTIELTITPAHDAEHLTLAPHVEGSTAPYGSVVVDAITPVASCP